MCLCRKFATNRGRYRYTLLSEAFVACFLAILYINLTFFSSSEEELPWNFHSYFAYQAAHVLIIMAFRQREIRFLARYESDDTMVERIDRRVLFFDGWRCLAFTVNAVLSFALFKVHEFFGYNEKGDDTIWYYGFIAYLIYVCFIGGFYSLFVLCDLVRECRKWRKKVADLRTA